MGSIGKSGDDKSVCISSSPWTGVFDRAVSLVFDEEIDIVEEARAREDPRIFASTLFDVDEPDVTLVSFTCKEASRVEIDSPGSARIPKNPDLWEDATRAADRAGVPPTSLKTFSRDIGTRALRGTPATSCMSMFPSRMLYKMKLTGIAGVFVTR